MLCFGELLFHEHAEHDDQVSIMKSVSGKHREEHYDQYSVHAEQWESGEHHEAAMRGILTKTTACGTLRVWWAPGTAPSAKKALAEHADHEETGEHCEEQG